ncbi:MAG: acetylxylan esterase [Clostridia bacterium]|nr:acetylxylan esterase [Clostridia bacterium]
MNKFDSFLNATPVVKKMPAYNPTSHTDGTPNEWAHIEAITYDGASIGDKKTKVFAYIGFPAEAATQQVPAIVLVHGGGGHAFAEWVKMWNDRGYAAIAMDNTGYYPSSAGTGVAGRELDDQALWHPGLRDDFNEEGYTSAPGNDGMFSFDKPLDQQWMYHAVAGTIMAHNILRADERVDNTRIGITGISWGGVITSLTIGYDTRYAFAIPIYGSGYLDISRGWMVDHFGNEPTKKQWSAAHRFDKVAFPVLWSCFPDDTPFSVNSNSLSYEDTKVAGAILSMRQGMGHSHLRGWTPPESFRFADSIAKDGLPLTACVTEPTGRDFSFEIAVPADATAVTARIVYITETLSYSKKKEEDKTVTIDQRWQFAPCAVEGNTVSGILPDEAVDYYVELSTVTPDNTYITTSRFIEGA